MTALSHVFVYTSVQQCEYLNPGTHQVREGQVTLTHAGWAFQSLNISVPHFVPVAASQRQPATAATANPATTAIAGRFRFLVVCMYPFSIVSTALLVGASV